MVFLHEDDELLESYRLQRRKLHAANLLAFYRNAAEFPATSQAGKVDATLKQMRARLEPSEIVQVRTRGRQVGAAEIQLLLL